MARKGFYFNQDACAGCRTCQVACKDKNDLEIGTIYRKVDSFETGEFPTSMLYHLTHSCNHCESPACVANCPTGAMAKREEDGIVESDPSVCIGCGACAKSCPYEAPVVADALGIAMKCDFCRPRVERGEEPLCVCSCPAEARIFGEISDETSEVSKLMAELSAEPLLPEEGTEPSVRYC